MLQILKEYNKGDLIVTEYTLDGVSVSHIVEQLSGSSTSNPPPQMSATIEEQILTENQYQTALLEMNMIGGV